MRRLPAGARGGCGGVGEGGRCRHSAALAACAAASRAVSGGSLTSGMHRRANSRLKCFAWRLSHQVCCTLPRQRRPSSSRAPSGRLHRASFWGRACVVRGDARAAPRPRRRAPAGRRCAPPRPGCDSLTLSTAFNRCVSQSRARLLARERWARSARRCASAWFRRANPRAAV